MEWLIQLSRERGYVVKALAEMPVLFRYLEPVMEAFHMLSASRQIGGMGGVGPISLSDVLTYLNWTGINRMDEQRKWVRMLRSMDNAFLAHVNAKET